MRARFSAERKLSTWPASDCSKSIAFFLTAVVALSSGPRGDTCDLAEIEQSRIVASKLMKTLR
jgi:hypothetical protein